MKTLHPSFGPAANRVAATLVLLASLLPACGRLQLPAPESVAATPVAGRRSPATSASLSTAVTASDVPQLSSTPVSRSASQLLPIPTIGLASLTGYHVSFRQSMTASLEGKPFERQTEIDLTRARGQADFTFHQESTTEPDSYTRLISLDGAVYRWQAANQTCQGSPGSVADGEAPEPALRLLPIAQASQVGVETINQVPTLHYHFDQDALRLADPKPLISGDVWIARTGGYVVRFILNAAAPSELSGQDVSTAQSWVYELSQVDQVQPIALPKGCVAVPMDIPSMPDAQQVARFNGMMTYITSAKASELVDFYLQALAMKGWSTGQKKKTGDIKLPYALAFTKGDQELSVYIDAHEGGGLDIVVMIYHPGETTPASPEATATSEPISVPAPTVAPSESGLPADVHLYPGATNLIQLEAAVKFDVPDTAETVARFYHDQMIAKGWTLMMAQDQNGSRTQIWRKKGCTVSLVITTRGETTSVILSQAPQCKTP